MKYASVLALIQSCITRVDAGEKFNEVAAEIDLRAKVSEAATDTSKSIAVLEVNGGVVELLAIHGELDVILLDRDTQGSGGEDLVEVNGDECLKSHWASTWETSDAERGALAVAIYEELEALYRAETASA
jgi:hypothetical protein